MQVFQQLITRSPEIIAQKFKNIGNSSIAR